ncbi:MAG: diaminopimelate decarboxylase [Actinobacteria bacterium]|nr:diaminopimelate decarboxylase [Actinomycetota bacterium]
MSRSAEDLADSYPKGFLSTNTQIKNSNKFGGEISIANCSAQSLANKYGTPLFIMDIEDFKVRAGAWQSELSKHFSKSKCFYAGKAFLSIAIAKLLKDLGYGLDVCTGGELAVGLAANFPASEIEFHGNNKSEVEIKQAIDANVGIIVLDSNYEIERVAKIAKAAGKVQNVLVRLTPGVVAHTHEYISTAQEDTKFGFSIASNSAMNAIELIEKNENLNLIGVHCHIGSQILSTEGFELAADRLLTVLKNYKDKYGKELTYLNLGGGFGIAYTEGEKSLSPKDVIPRIAKRIKEFCANNSLAQPMVLLEPGRAVVGPAMSTLYTVGTIKQVQLEDNSKRTYIAVDGGMSDNIRPALYEAKYQALVANRSPKLNEIEGSARLVGKHCETGDILIFDQEFPSDIKVGDLLLIPATGAYGRSMASNYNHITKPAVVAVENGMAKQLLRRESTADLLALEVDEPAAPLK